MHYSIDQRIDNIRLAHVRLETMIVHLTEHLDAATTNVRLLQLELKRERENAKA